MYVTETGSPMNVEFFPVFLRGKADVEVTDVSFPVATIGSPIMAGVGEGEAPDGAIVELYPVSVRGKIDDGVTRVSFPVATIGSPMMTVAEKVPDAGIEEVNPVILASTDVVEVTALEGIPVPTAPITTLAGEVLDATVVEVYPVMVAYKDVVEVTAAFEEDVPVPTAPITTLAGKVPDTAIVEEFPARSAGAGAVEVIPEVVEVTNVFEGFPVL